jgi:hypothetical protein
MHRWTYHDDHMKCFRCGLKVDSDAADNETYPLTCEHLECEGEDNPGRNHYIVTAPHGAEYYYCGKPFH